MDCEDRDLSIFYTVARCMMEKSGTLLNTKHLNETITVEGLTKALDSFITHGFDFQVENYQLMQEIFREIFIKKTCHLSVERDSHLVVFYPLQSQNLSDHNLTKINEAFQLNDRFSNLKLSWASINELKGDHALLRRAQALNEEKKESGGDDFDYILLNADDRDHVQLMNEAIFHGTFFRPEDRWGYFNVFDSKFPSKE